MSPCSNLVAVTILALSTSTWAKPLDRRQELDDNILSVCLPAVTSYITVNPLVVPTVTVIATSLPSSYAAGPVSNETTKSLSDESTITSSAFPGTTSPSGGSAPISSTSLWNTSEPIETAARSSSLASIGADSSLLTPSNTSSASSPETITDSPFPTATSSRPSGALMSDDTSATVDPVDAFNTIPVTLSISEVTSGYTSQSWITLGSPLSSSGILSMIFMETLSPTESGFSPESITISVSTSSPPISSSKTNIEVGPTNAPFTTQYLESEMTETATTIPTPESDMTGTSTPTTTVSASTTYQTTTSISSPESIHESGSPISTPCTESDCSFTSAPASPQTTSLPPYPTDNVCPTSSVIYSTLTATTTIIETTTSTRYPSFWVASWTDSGPSTTPA